MTATFYESFRSTEFMLKFTPDSFDGHVVLQYLVGSFDVYIWVWNHRTHCDFKQWVNWDLSDSQSKDLSDNWVIPSLPLAIFEPFSLDSLVKLWSVILKRNWKFPLPQLHGSWFERKSSSPVRNRMVLRNKALFPHILTWGIPFFIVVWRQVLMEVWHAFSVCGNLAYHTYTDSHAIFFPLAKTCDVLSDPR